MIKRIKSIDLNEAIRLGIPRRTYYRLKKILDNGKDARLRGKTKRRFYNNI